MSGRREFELFLKEITEADIPEPIKEEIRRKMVEAILADVKKKKKPSLFRRLINFFRRTKT